MTILAAAFNGKRDVEMLIPFSHVYVTETALFKASELIKEFRIQIRVLNTRSS